LWGNNTLPGQVMHHARRCVRELVQKKYQQQKPHRAISPFGTLTRSGVLCWSSGSGTGFLSIGPSPSRNKRDASGIARGRVVRGEGGDWLVGVCYGGEVGANVLLVKEPAALSRRGGEAIRSRLSRTRFQPRSAKRRQKNSCYDHRRSRYEHRQYPCNALACITVYIDQPHDDEPYECLHDYEVGRENIDIIHARSPCRWTRPHESGAVAPSPRESVAVPTKDIVLPIAVPLHDKHIIGWEGIE
jgi:hypothetical protein